MIWEIGAALLFFVLILVSIGLHELGHFLPSKAFGVKVRQFMIGFGPTLWNTQKGETEYGVKAIPLGGYCAVVGMLPPYREGKNTWLKRFADAVREADWEHITDQDVATGRLFYQQRYLRRLLIMAGGVLTNLLLAFGLFLTCNLAWGQYPEEPTLTVARVVDCLPASDPDSPCVATPASAAGVQPDDTLVGLNGQMVDSYSHYRQVIGETATTDEEGQLRAGNLTVMVDRPGLGQITLPTVPGMIVTFNDGTTGPYLGVSLQNERVPVGPVGTLQDMGDLAWLSIKAIVRLPYYAWTTLRDLVTGAPRDQESVMSIIGAARVAGEVATTDQLDRGARVFIYLYLLGSVNLFVALLNLVPLLPFDGGHVAAGFYGVLRSGWAKWRGRPDPGPVDAAKLQPVAYIVGGFLMLFGAILIVADIFTPIRLF